MDIDANRLADILKEASLCRHLLQRICLAKDSGSSITLNALIEDASKLFTANSKNDAEKEDSVKFE
jgi:hypothetical protein